VFERLFEFIGQFSSLFQLWEIVDPYQGGLVLRLGKFHRELKPGFNWLIPMRIERTITEFIVPRTSRIHAMSTDTKDGVTIGFEAVITWKINDLKKSLLEVAMLKDAIADCCMGVIGTELTESTWEEIKHGETLEAVSAACRKNGWKWGVEIIRVQLTGVARARNIRLLQDQYSLGLSVDTHGSDENA
jgi:regulator of protease activity HflC (stomatin/prohibitin superfamily)